MSVLSVSELTMGFGERILFERASFSIEKGEKAGLIGANGTGKTTLFNLITGTLSADSGNISIPFGTNVGILSQFACRDSQKTVYEETLSVFDNLMQIEAELDSVSKMLDRQTDAALIEKQQHLQEEFLAKGGMTYKSRTASTLAGLGFSDADQKLFVSTQSGGQRAKIGLAKLLLAQPDLLLLDEPTNHLDIASIEWLEEYIKDFNGAAIIVSHDRYFLDKVTNKTIEIENCKVHSFAGNYTRFAEQKELRQKTVARQYENTMKEVKRIEGIIEQQHQFNRERNIKMAESKQKQIDRMVKDLQAPDKVQRQARFCIKPIAFSGFDVLCAKDLTASFKDKTLYEKVSLSLEKEEKVFILGDNGVGKTTLLRQLLDRRGKITFGAGVKVGYFDQLGATLNDAETVLECMQNAYPQMSLTDMRNCLAAFLFVNDDVFKLIGDLSGGEKARLMLCRLLCSGANLLFLDEPTNHLDINSRTALEEVLAEYEGTILAVSHDRYFINKIATRVAQLKPDGIVMYEGGYDAYHTAREKEKMTVQQKPKKEMGQGGKNYHEAKQKAAALRKLKSELERTEKLIEQAESECEQIQKDMENLSSDYEEITRLSAVLEQNRQKTEELYEKWAELSDQLAESE